jgi:hypothetical protein
MLKKPYPRQKTFRGEPINGEMPELAEGARLEIVCTPKRCTEGSNPSLSARLHFGLRNSNFEMDRG